MLTDKCAINQNHRTAHHVLLVFHDTEVVRMSLPEHLRPTTIDKTDNRKNSIIAHQITKPNRSHFRNFSKPQILPDICIPTGLYSLFVSPISQHIMLLWTRFPYKKQVDQKLTSTRLTSSHKIRYCISLPLYDFGHKRKFSAHYRRTMRRENIPTHNDSTSAKIAFLLLASRRYLTERFGITEFAMDMLPLRPF